MTIFSVKASVKDGFGQKKILVVDLLLSHELYQYLVSVRMDFELLHLSVRYILMGAVGILGFNLHLFPL